MGLTKKLSVVLAICLAIGSFCISATAATAITNPVDIVVVIDVSGSVNDLDIGYTMQDTAQLIVDLAPEVARVGVLTVNTDVVGELGLTEASDPAGRSSLYSFIDSISYQGDTNFAVGLDRAVSMLESSPAESQKRIIFLGDVGEGGFNASNDTASAVSLLSSVSQRAVETGIQIDFLLLRTVPEASTVGPVFVRIPDDTGGALRYAQTIAEFPRYVEEILLSNYTYQQNIETYRLSSSQQTITIDFPTPYINRARVYIPTSSLDGSVRASYAGADLRVEQTDYYSIIHLTRPAQAPISLTLPPSESGHVSVYSFYEYSLETQIRTFSDMVIPEGEREEVQVTLFDLDFVDTVSGETLFSLSDPGDAEIEVSLAVQGGDHVSYAPTNRGINAPEAAGLAYEFLPEVYGNYSYGCSVSFMGKQYVFPTDSFAVEEIVVENNPWMLTITAACIIGAAVIIAAIIISRKHRKDKIVHRARAVPITDNDYFNGRLSIYSIIVEGGARDVRPFEFSLTSVRPARRVTMKDMFEANKMPATYTGLENILFLVGPENSIIVKNDTDGVIRISGKDYQKGQKVALYYGDKMHVILKPDVDEIEVVYRQPKEAALSPNSGNVTPLYFNSRRSTK